MISVSITPSEKISKTIDIEMLIPNPTLQNICLQLPAWRPGRYELQNFAKNLSFFSAYNEEQEILTDQKLSKDAWFIHSEGHKMIKLKYCYYSNQMDAGGSYLTDQMLYINFINCIFYVDDRLDESYEVVLNIPEDFTISCGLPTIAPKTLSANSFYDLVDSPLIASANLQNYSYEVENTKFNIWIEGQHNIDTHLLINDFHNFSQVQFDIFGKYPFSEYHFQFILLPYGHYHGVEHNNSTVIVLGPDYKMHRPEMYKEILGISCHELFHAWNALKIKPKELTPYNYKSENYFDTGYVIEGFTTYYGDYLLLRCGIWGTNEYFNELNTTLKREFDNFGNDSASLARSSMELWLDGYLQGIPNRKVSIYTKGCVFALILDLKIRQATNNQKSLDNVLKVLWQLFGETGKGYSSFDVIQITEEVSQTDLSYLFEKGIYQTGNLISELNSALEWIGCSLHQTESQSNTENFFGFRTSEREGKTYVDYCAPESEANMMLAKNDEIIAINGRKVSNNIQELILLENTVEIAHFRDNQLRSLILHKTENRYFSQYKVATLHPITDEMKDNFISWANL